MEKSRRAAAIPPLLELVGLERRAKTKLSAFSKGMLQRIGLAQALLNEPELVFLDEPTSGLDPLGRRLGRDIITGVRAEKITVFLNSHLLSEIELTCDRVAFIREGVIVRVATLEELEQERIQITIRVGRPTQELVNGLAQYGDGVTLDESSGRIHLTIADESQMPQIVNWLVEQDQAVYELSPRRRSLEDRFLEIVGDEMYDS
jgi:ABC-2 type transport system ATP-binding protein